MWFFFFFKQLQFMELGALKFSKDQTVIEKIQIK